GLVTAIPALLVSMSGGLITTRAASESHLGEEVAVEVFARARPLAGAARVLAALARIPGLAALSFRRVSCVLGGAAYANRREETPEATPEPTTLAAAEATADPIGVVDPLAVEVGYALVALVDEKQGGPLLARVRAIRRQIATETGLLVPSVR